MLPEIPFLDLRRLQAPRAQALQDALAAVVARGIYILGPELEAFEAEFAAYCGTRHAIGVGNGLDALRLMLQASSLEPGDELLVPAHTFIATILAVRAAGLVPILVEPDPDTFLMDPQAAERALTPRTRGLLTVHLYGRCSGVDALRALAERHDLALFEDAAQAHGARCQGTSAGAFGLAAGFSFYPTKNLGALGDGGAITTGDPALAETVCALRNYGSAHKHAYDLEGCNSRLDELQAAALRVNLRHLEADNARRQALAATYLAAMRNPRVLLPQATEDPASHIWHVFVVRSQDRGALQEHLASQGIGTAMHYPIPPHRQPALQGLAHGPLPLTEQLHREVLSLPLHPGLTHNEALRVIKAVNNF
jgi:dTDP-4-amino-4,6-dideoxygalactose transaminase